jgi:DNA-binding Xre family transcriptional regulator
MTTAEAGVHKTQIHKMSTKKRKPRTYWAITSKLDVLLQERGRTPAELSHATGITLSAVLHLSNRRTLLRIDCLNAIKICLTLSGWKRRSDRKKVPVRLDGLFRMIQKRAVT